MGLHLSFEKKISFFTLIIGLLFFKTVYSKNSSLVECHLQHGNTNVTLRSLNEKNGLRIQVDLLSHQTPIQNKTPLYFQALFFEDSDYNKNFFSIELEIGGVTLIREVLMGRFGRQGINKIWDQIKKIQVYSSLPLEQFSDVKIILLYSQEGALLGKIGHYFDDVYFCQLENKNLILM